MELGPEHIITGGIAYLAARNLYHVGKGYKQAKREIDQNGVNEPTLEGFISEVQENDSALDAFFSKERGQLIGETFANIFTGLNYEAAAERYESVPSLEEIDENREYVRKNLENEVSVLNQGLYHGHEL